MLTMTDTEYLKWVAEHVVTFHFGLYTAYLVYIDDLGKEQKTSLEFEQLDEDDTILKRLIDKAIEDEKNSVI